MSKYSHGSFHVVPEMKLMKTKRLHMKNHILLQFTVTSHYYSDFRFNCLSFMFMLRPTLYGAFCIFMLVFFPSLE